MQVFNSKKYTDKLRQHDHTIHCYWFIPITEKERDYKIDKGCEALEQLFEEKQLDYLNPGRGSLVS